MRFLLLFAYILAFSWMFESSAQQTINKLNVKELDVNERVNVNSTTQSSKPCPAMTEAQRDAIVSPLSGSCVYNTNTLTLNIYNGTIWKSAGGGISNWETAFNYALNDVVIESNKIYQCNTAHTSTVFASDISNWTLISDNLPVDLAANVTGVLPMASGGTDKALTPTLGGVVYTDANSMEVLAAGTSGQVLKSNGAAAPTWQDASNKLQGQDQSEVNFTKLKVPKRSATPTASGEYLLEPNDNLLYNGGFEATPNLDGWTCVGAGSSFTIESKPVSASVVISGDKTLAIGCATVGGCTCTQDFPVNQQQAGRSVLLSGIVRSSSDTQGLKLTYRENGADTSVTTENVLNGIPATEAVIGSSATTIGIKLTVPYSATPLVVRVDEIKMVYGTAVTNQPAIGPRVQYTPTFTGFGTVTNVNCSGQQVGSEEVIDCTFTSGTSTGVEARVSLRSGLTSSATLPTLSFAGYGVISAASTGQYATLIEPSVSYLTFGIQQSSAGLVKLNGNAFISSGQTYSFKARVPIAQYASSVPTYTGRCDDPRKCETVFSAKISSAGVVSGENLDWVNGNATITNTSTYDLVLNTSLFGNIPNCSFITKLNSPADNTNIGERLISTSTTNVIYRITGNSGPLASDAEIICQRQGQDYINAKVNQIVGSFKDYVKTPNTTSGKVGFCSAKISATGVISDHLGGCFASCTNATTPVCTFTSNYWKSGSVPNCQVASIDQFSPSLNSITTTAYGGAIVNPVSGGVVSGPRLYFCHGEIQ